MGEAADALKTASILNTATPGTVKQIWVAAGAYLPLYPADAVTTGTAITTDRKNAFVLIKDRKSEDNNMSSHPLTSKNPLTY